jgi:hypothetical protein
MDAEALAAGAEPVFALDAALHVLSCELCRDQVALAHRLYRSLEEAPADHAMPNLSDRILRLRAFSRRERRDFSLWRGAWGLVGGTFFAGLLVVTLPALTLREQAGLSGMAIGPLWMLWKAFGQALGQGFRASPAALAALSDVLKQQQTLGLASLALLGPVLFGLRRALARARR